MGLKDNLEKEVRRILKDQWQVTEGRVVPDPANIGLSNEAVHFERATILYADLSGSTKMVDTMNWHLAAEAYRSYLFCAAKLIREEGGEITAYDGDRIMGVFIGDNQSTHAAWCGLKINYAVGHIINPAIQAQYPSTPFAVRQIVGIDTGEIRVARTGVRGGNDLVWIGRAANYAAKLCQLDVAYPTWITDSVFQRLNGKAKYGSDGRLMWERMTWHAMNKLIVHRSNWWWRV